jgi:hypothetical protein
LNLPLEKQIKIVNCTKYYEHGLMEDPLIRIFMNVKVEGEPVINGSFPKLIFEGLVLEGAKSEEEMQQIIKTLVHKDLIIKEQNDLMFTKECRFEKRRLIGKFLRCE